MDLDAVYLQLIVSTEGAYFPPTLLNVCEKAIDTQ